MTLTNRELVARLYEMWNAGQADAAFRDHWADDAVLHFPDEFPESGPWVGREAIIAEFHRLREDFGRQHLTVSDVVEHGDWVVTRTVWHVRGDHSGIEGEFALGVAFRLSGSRVAEARYFWEYADALGAAGLPGHAR